MIEDGRKPGWSGSRFRGTNFVPCSSQYTRMKKSLAREEYRLRAQRSEKKQNKTKQRATESKKIRKYKKKMKMAVV